MSTLKSLNHTVISVTYWVGSIGEIFDSGPEVGVSTSNGKAYFLITSLLKRLGFPFIDVLPRPQPQMRNDCFSNSAPYVERNIKVIITTRREHVQFYGPAVICIEDIGDDSGIARAKILSFLYPAKPYDWFIIGIDPGKRTGVAAFMNHREVESSVVQSFDETISRVCALIDNSPDIQKVVKIGSGNKYLAEKIALILDSRYHDEIRIQLVNESGTSSLSRKRGKSSMTGTRDQRAAKLIAFRDGQDFIQAQA
ncbi:MAG TPA: hypothetical protein VN739_09100 [Nitrososphaerales archaeon]|nr:hypothetical protein [Nitrososphaerales archaeon]